MAEQLIDVWVVYGPEGKHGGQAEPLEVFLDVTEAESWMAGQVMQETLHNILHVEPGGTLSLMVHRAAKGEEEGGTAGLVIANGGSRHSSDYHIEKVTGITVKPQP